MRRRPFLIPFLLTVLAPAALAAPIALRNESPTPALGVVYTLVDDAPVNGSASVDSDGLDLSQNVYLGAWYRCSSASGAPDVDLLWQESPTPEEADFVSVLTFADNVTAETPNIAAISPPPMRYGRVRVAGNAGNASDTVCTVKVFMQRAFP